MNRTGYLGLPENAFYGAARIVHSVAFGVLALALVASLALPASAQKNSKDDKNAKNTTIKKDVVPLLEEPAGSSVVPLPDAQAIELMVSQMLAAWQLGDEQLLHTFYAEDVLVISGAWEPPLQGWPSYLHSYQAQRARMQAVRMDRTNTFTKILGTTAWCTYQWEFSGQVDGAPANSVGQTTLVLEKRAGKWVIAINHTSVSATQQRPVPSTAAPNPRTLQPTSSPRTGATPGA